VEKLLHECALNVSGRVKDGFANAQPTSDTRPIIIMSMRKYIPMIKIIDFISQFEDGEKINIKDLDYNIVKPLIWW